MLCRYGLGKEFRRHVVIREPMFRCSGINQSVNANDNLFYLQVAFRYKCSTSHGVNAPIAERSDTDADDYQITKLDAAMD